ncbi:uncharacterized protein LOC6566649 [Drosophila grimshawi]|uniref:Transcription initiation factor TFIID subunit 12 n=1 Tax=Drosophila grimshawi TaxID=7222 RepID=B4JQQ8_DROGR|nr:uncharacterized protein LOC6566649 [Drosophila grimshawi]EDV99238.1 GH13137 [Drosophila grimshawi]
MNNFPWFDELPDNYTDLSSGNESESSAFSLSSSGKSNQAASDKEHLCSSSTKCHIIGVANLNRFIKKIDKAASMDDQAADLVAKCVNTFVKDVSMRLVTLAKYRNAEPSTLDLKFTLKREYNMEFPHTTNFE